jgi:hypothetical protein
MLDPEITADSLFDHPEMLSKFLDDVSRETSTPFLERIKNMEITVQVNGKFNPGLNN